MEKQKLFFDIWSLILLQMFMTFAIIFAEYAVVSSICMTVLVLCYLVLMVIFYRYWYGSGDYTKSDYTELDMRTALGDQWYLRARILIFAHIQAVLIFAMSVRLSLSVEEVGQLFLILSFLASSMVYHFMWEHFAKKIEVLSKI